MVQDVQNVGHNADTTHNLVENVILRLSWALPLLLTLFFWMLILKILLSLTTPLILGIMSLVSLVSCRRVFRVVWALPMMVIAFQIPLWIWIWALSTLGSVRFLKGPRQALPLRMVLGRFPTPLWLGSRSRLPLLSGEGESLLLCMSSVRGLGLSPVEVFRILLTVLFLPTMLNHGCVYSHNQCSPAT